MRKILKWTGILVGVILLGLVITGLVLHERRPQGTAGPEADALAKTMLDAVNQAAWDSTRYVQWTFTNRHHYLWDREAEWVEVRWSNNRVLLHTPTQKGHAWQDETAVEGDVANNLLKTAWAFFCNDSFWLAAFNKVFDEGTQRQLVPQPDGSDALLVTYASGGVTPGDSYLWLLDENGLPQAWKMWVSVIPVGGLSFTWENWKELSTGAMVALDHKNQLANVALTNVRGGISLPDIGVTGNPFAKAELPAK